MYLKLGMLVCTRLFNQSSTMFVVKHCLLSMELSPMKAVTKHSVISHASSLCKHSKRSSKGTFPQSCSTLKCDFQQLERRERKQWASSNYCLCSEAPEGWVRPHRRRAQLRSGEPRAANRLSRPGRIDQKQLEPSSQSMKFMNDELRSNHQSTIHQDSRFSSKRRERFRSRIPPVWSCLFQWVSWLLQLLQWLHIWVWKAPRSILGQENAIRALGHFINGRLRPWNHWTPEHLGAIYWSCCQREILESWFSCAARWHHKNSQGTWWQLGDSAKMVSQRALLAGRLQNSIRVQNEGISLLKPVSGCFRYLFRYLLNHDLFTSTPTLALAKSNESNLDEPGPWLVGEKSALALHGKLRTRLMEFRNWKPVVQKVHLPLAALLSTTAASLYASNIGFTIQKPAQRCNYHYVGKNYF